MIKTHLEGQYIYIYIYIVFLTAVSSGGYPVLETQSSRKKKKKKEIIEIK